MKKFKILALIVVFLVSSAIAKTQQEEYKNDVLYSQEYFDYLIECASIADFEMKEEAKKQKKSQEEISLDEITPEQDEVALDKSDTEPFKLRIENNGINAYKESIKQEDTKTTIQINNKFSIIHDTYKFKNKYNSNDFRLKTGAEYNLSKNIILSSGLETNYRGQNQVPISKKLYFSPTLKLNEKFSVSFINKYDTTSNSTDCDMSFNISPFKSKVTDFNVYAGYTKESNGSSSESILFTTNFYF